MRAPLNARRGEEDKGGEKKRKGGGKKHLFTSPSIITPNEEWAGKKKIAEETFHYDEGKKACQVEKAKQKIDSFFNG